MPSIQYPNFSDAASLSKTSATTRSLYVSYLQWIGDFRFKETLQFVPHSRTFSLESQGSAFVAESDFDSQKYLRPDLYFLVDETWVGRPP